MQTNRIRKSVEKWLTDTDIANIRKNAPKLKEFPAGCSEKRKQAIIAENKKLIEAQSRENISKILDAALEAHAEETLEIMALLCFVEPENVDDYPMSFYIRNITELLKSEETVAFFTSLLSLGKKNIF